MRRNDYATAEDVTSQHNLIFWLHILITLLAWLGPFLFSWYLMVAAYLVVLIQFMIFDRCILNTTHDLEDDDDSTLYSYALEKLGWDVDRSELKLWVRQYFYVVLSAVAILWQAILGFDPLLFFKT